MGLGLSIAYQLVQKNGGTIDVMSEEGKGTVFTVRFPIP
jgi:signal transduction histidine kinase